MTPPQELLDTIHSEHCIIIVACSARLLQWGYIGVNIGVNIGIMENKIETTGTIGFIWV